MRTASLLASMTLALSFTAGVANAQLPNEEKYAFLQDVTRTLNFTAPGISIAPSTGGTSVYAVYSVNGKPVGAVLPENAATKISGEIMTFYIARALGVDELYSPAIYHRLTGSNLQAFRRIIPNTPYKSKWKEKNRLDIIARIAKNPGGIDTAYKHWGKKPTDYDALVSVSSNSFNSSKALPGSSTAFSSFLKCNGVRPSQSKQISFNGGVSTEFELARQLSSIFLIDALAQQWDRFSGGNLQTAVFNGEVKFVSYDNGGTWGGTAWTQKFLNIVSRFDRDVANEILALDAAITNGGSYNGIPQAELAKALGVERFPNSMAAFRKSLHLVASHIRKNSGCYF